MEEVYIYQALRTVRGKGSKKGALAGVRPVELVKTLLDSLSRTQEHAAAGYGDLVLGCVTQWGDQGANIAKISALYGGLPHSVPGMTVNRFCSSSLDAVAVAAGRVSSGMDQCVLAGGVESMSRVPMFADKGAWFADRDVAKQTRFLHMGVAADLLASRFGITRAQLDGYAQRSQERALQAWDQGCYGKEVVAVQAGPETKLERDECPRRTTQAGLEQLPALFAEHTPHGQIAKVYPDATCEALHTVASSPALADGASLLVIANKEWGEARGHKPRGRIHGVASVGVEPLQMLDGNVVATQQALSKCGASPADVDAYEVNESFAAVPIHFQRSLEILPERLNAWGGAIALGHPLGATGGVLLTTLLRRLEQADEGLGVASICGGAGVATSVVVERV